MVKDQYPKDFSTWGAIPQDLAAKFAVRTLSRQRLTTGSVIAILINWNHHYWKKMTMGSSLRHFFGSFDLSLDLGTEHTRLCCNLNKTSITEASCIALRRGRRDAAAVLAVGYEAALMTGRVSNQLVDVSWPLSDGVIIDTTKAILMVKALIQRFPCIKNSALRRMVISAPYAITTIEQRAFRDVAKGLKAKEIMLIEEPISAALGSNIEILRSCGNMLIDIGHGIIESVVISNGYIVASSSLRLTGKTDVERIIHDIKSSEQVLISQAEADRIIQMANYFTNGELIAVKGKDLLTGRLVKRSFPREILSGIFKLRLDEIEACIIETLDDTSGELVGDIFENGIHLTGGGALLNEISTGLSERLKVRVFPVKDPLAAIAIGNQRILNDIKLFQHLSSRNEAF